jgi:hypothetical protein
MVAFPPNSAFAEIWEKVRAWPAEERRLLARQIVESLRSESSPPTVVAPPPKPTTNAADLIGLWSDVDPKPTDEDLKRILEESILEKHWL